MHHVTTTVCETEIQIEGVQLHSDIHSLDEALRSDDSLLDKDYSQDSSSENDFDYNNASDLKTPISRDEADLSTYNDEKIQSDCNERNDTEGEGNVVVKLEK